jgi:hypothetical protein
VDDGKVTVLEETKVTEEESVDGVLTKLQLQEDEASFIARQDQFRRELSETLGVPESWIQLDVVQSRRRLLGTAQSITVEVLIRPPIPEATLNNTNLTVVLSQIQGESAAEKVFGLNASTVLVEAPQFVRPNVTVTTTILTEDVVSCKKGYFCSAGKEFACPKNTYNDADDAIDMSFCKQCPENALSETNSSDISQCICKPDYYDNDPSPDLVVCTRCKIGSYCTSDQRGLTLATLPLERGYYRTSNTSEDLRLCPDGAEVSSGCPGGVGDEGPCQPFCE